jgi:hypothetical protein
MAVPRSRREDGQLCQLFAQIFGRLRPAFVSGNSRPGWPCRVRAREDGQLSQLFAQIFGRLRPAANAFDPKGVKFVSPRAQPWVFAMRPRDRKPQRGATDLRRPCDQSIFGRRLGACCEADANLGPSDSHPAGKLRRQPVQGL